MSNTWFVSPRGSKDNDGSLSRPWPLAYAAAGADGHILPGDIIYLRGGRYRTQKGPRVTVSGSNRMPITFRAYPGEAPVLYGASDDFRTPGHSAWERVFGPFPNQHLYASKTLHPASPEYGGLIELPDGVYSLATHPSLSFLTSDNHFFHPENPRYLGPGITYVSSNQRIYIRLDNADEAAQAGRTTVTQISNPDPNAYAIHIAPNDHVGLRVSGSHLVFERIRFHACHTCWLVEGSPTDLSFIDCVGEPLRFVARLAAATNVKILGGTYCGHMHSANWWLSGVDIKGIKPPAKPQAKRAFDLGAASNVEIGPSPKTGRRMTISQFFDGLLGSECHDVRVHGVWFDEIWDDAWQQYTKLRRVWYYDNVHWGAGPSRDRSSSIPSDGSIYIFDNVIDTTVHQIFAYRPPHAGPPVRDPPAFNSHGGNDPNPPEFPWKLYHNTIVVGSKFGEWAYLDAGRIGVPRSGSGAMTSGPPHEVYNNIFVVPDGRPLSDTFDARTGLEIYDGNCLWSNGAWKDKNGPYRFVWSSTGLLNNRVPPGDELESVEDLQNSQAARDSQEYYESGWEASSVEVDPGLDSNYVPTHPRVVTGAIDLTSKGWKGTARTSERRGATLTAGLPPRPGQVYVPDVIESRRDVAKKYVEEAGLTATFAGATGPDTYVDSQMPAQGTVVAVGSVVRLAMRTTPPQV